MIINFRQREDGSCFIVFMIPGNRFLKGIIEPDLLARVGDLKAFWWADIEFVDSEDEDALLDIVNLRMDKL